MANELQVRHPLSGRTVRFLLWDSVARVWDGAAFVAYATAGLDGYAIAAAEQGTASGRYAGDFPAGVPAGVYYAEAFDRAGAALAEADEFLGSETVHWTGAAVSPNAGAALDQADGLEGGVTVREGLRAIGATAVGLLPEGAGSGTEAFRGVGQPASAPPRVTNVVTANGDRVSQVLDL